MTWSEGNRRPALCLSARSNVSSANVPFDAGRGNYQGRLRMSKSFGRLSLEGHTGISTSQQLHGWRHETARAVVRGSLSATYRRNDHSEGLIEVSGVREMTPASDRRSVVTADIGGGLFVHTQVFASLLLRYRSDGAIMLRPGVMVSL